MSADFKTAYSRKQRFFEAALFKLFVKTKAPDGLTKAVRYSLEAGGKRIRPVICLLVDDLLRGKTDTKHSQEVLNYACALECIHTYSLIHDDLPSMDDDDLRRGKPTSHIVFGEGAAILAGDSLNTYAFEISTQLVSKNPEGILAAANYLANCSGICGMAGGQALDLESENKKIDLSAMKKIHSMKTGALIRAAAVGPALLKGAGSKTCKSLEDWALQLGVAFQITDDILDVTASTAILGKDAGSDIENQKATYVSLLGLDSAKKAARQTEKKALKCLERLPGNTDMLKKLTEFVNGRKN